MLTPPALPTRNSKVPSASTDFVWLASIVPEKMYFPLERAITQTGSVAVISIFTGPLPGVAAAALGSARFASAVAGAAPAVVAGAAALTAAALGGAAAGAGFGCCAAAVAAAVCAGAGAAARCEGGMAAGSAAAISPGCGSAAPAAGMVAAAGPFPAAGAPGAAGCAACGTGCIGGGVTSAVRAVSWGDDWRRECCQKAYTPEHTIMTATTIASAGSDEDQPRRSPTDSHSSTRGRCSSSTEPSGS